MCTPSVGLATNQWVLTQRCSREPLKAVGMILEHKRMRTSQVRAVNRATAWRSDDVKRVSILGRDVDFHLLA